MYKRQFFTVASQCPHIIPSICIVFVITFSSLSLVFISTEMCIRDRSRSREWLTEDKFLRDAKLQTRFADFIFEEVAQRLDDCLEIHIIRETADVVVGLDHCGFSAKSGLYHIRRCV